jgi:cytochrome P450
MPAMPPGPTALPIFGNLLAFARSPHDFLQALAETYGDIARFRVSKFNAYLLTNPDYIQDVLVRKKDHFVKSERSRRNLAAFLGQGLLTSEGEYHAKQRKMVQPAFHATRIFAYADSMVSITESLLEQWGAESQRDIHHDMMRITMEIVSKNLFGSAVADDAMRVGEAMVVLQDMGNKAFTSLFRLSNWFNTPERRRADAATETINSVVLRFIRERRAQELIDTGDLLSMLLLSEDEEGQRMSEQQVRDEAVTLFSAGHETTSNALSWTFYLLSQNPQAEIRLYEELDRVLAGRRPSLADLKQLPYTEMLIKEALRLYPPAWALMTRQVVKDIQFGDYTIPKGSFAVVSPYTMHRSSRYWENPEAFMPERFSVENEAKMHKYQYFPFGGGTRVCIGNSFAMMEAQLVLATIASRYRLRMLPGHPVEAKSLITLLPSHGLKMQVEQRAMKQSSAASTETLLQA